jgi:hypothetical protein
VETGRIASPPFTINVDSIRFTVRGHDGQGGGRDENYVALVDNKTGNILRKTPAPGNDALQERKWDVAELKGRTVRFEAIDGNSDGAFAWLGVGQIDAGTDLSIDFRNGVPEDWKTTTEKLAHEGRKQIPVDSPIPFLVHEDSYTWIRENGSSHVRIGRQVKRLFVLGCTAPANRVLTTYGYLDLVYSDNTKDTFPLIYGYTLEGVYKMAGDYPSLQLLPVANGTQYALSIQPADKVIDRIELRRAAADLPRPRVSAITCELDKPVAEAELAEVALTSLASGPLNQTVQQWLSRHTLSSTSSPGSDVAQAVRQERGEPTSLASIQSIEAEPPVRFARTKISDEAFEAAAVSDIDGDGRKDIVSGNFWYSGPEFDKRHRFRSLVPTGGYHDSFHDYPMDVDGDGDVDIVTGGWFGGTLLWCENPGRASSGDWSVHEIGKTGAIETTRFWDVDGDGYVEIVPNAGGNVVFYRLDRDGTGKGKGRFTKHEVKLGGAGHGLGFGDINGDGRGDFVIPDGWLEAPDDVLHGEWKLHADFRLGSASVPILVHDVNRDGLADLIYGKAHGYGLFWVEQKPAKDGKTVWDTHPVDDKASQYHDMLLADLNGNGRMELVTGKRYHAHNGKDPGSADPLFVRYFVIQRPGLMTSHTVDFGSANEASGVGIYFWVEDIDGDGGPDIVAPGKEGLYLFRNLSVKR